MKTLYTLLIAIVMPVLAVAQTNNNFSQPCYTDELWRQVSALDTTLAKKRRQMDMAISVHLNKSDNAAQKNHRSLTGDAVVIPVVIYIVHDGTTASNISMQAIQSQMDQLNEDFLPLGISFCYARRNFIDTTYFVPASGDSAGVFRIASTLTNIDIATQDVQLKQLSTLHSKNYLRIFVVKSLLPVGVAGYAHFPGGNYITDGVVVRADVFGSNNFCPGCQLLSNYNLGAVLTHEVGHYLNLYHTFQGGCNTANNNPFVPACSITGDWICDTPPTTGNFGCPQLVPLSCDSINTAMIENYMDYTNDQCRNAFTTGQSGRMHATLDSYRNLLISPANLIKTGIDCVNLDNQFADFSCANFNGCTVQPMYFNSVGSTDFTYEWDFGNGLTDAGDTVMVNYGFEGQYNVTLTATNTITGVVYTNTQTVFITGCEPNTCDRNKLSSGMSFLDFSTGNAVAVSHPRADPDWPIAIYYQTFTRGDGQGNNFATISWGLGDSHELIDSSWNSVDSMGRGMSAYMFPVPGHPNRHCFLYTPNYPSDTLVSCIIDNNNGTPYILPGKKNIPLPVVGRARQSWTMLLVTAIPGCNDNENWIITRIDDSTLNVMSIDTGGTIQFRSLYQPTNIRMLVMRSSPDGRKLAVNYVTKTQPLTGGMMILDFNKSTGALTLSQFLPVAFGCFSPNSRFWYGAGGCCGPGTTTGTIYQYDLNSPNPAASGKKIYDYPLSNGTYPVPFLFNGADARTYVGFTDQPGNSTPLGFRLGLINFPDEMQTGVNTVGFNRMGPHIVPEDNTEPGTWVEGFINTLDIDDAFPCFEIPLKFSWRATSCFNYHFYSDECYNASWNFGDTQSGPANTASGTSVMHTFNSAGIYPVTMVSNGQTVRDTIIITVPQVHIAATPVLPCPEPFANYSLNTIQPYVNYQWTVTNGTPATAQNTGDLNVQWMPGTTGSVKVVARDTVYGCADSAVINLQVTPNFTLTNLHDSICTGAIYQFNNHQLTIAGTYNDTLTTTAGCDSIVQLKLDTIALKQNTKNAAICQGDSYNFMGITLSAAGIYSDTLTASTGCDSILVLMLAVDSLPVVIWPGGNDTITSVPNGIALNGGTPVGGVYSGNSVSNNIFYPDSTGTGAVTITYTYTDSNGCVASADRVFIITSITGNSKLQSSLHVYPQPVSDQLVVESEILVTENIETFLYDITGKQLAIQIQKAPNRIQLQTSSLPAGAYVLKLKVGNEFAYIRFEKLN